MERAIEVEGRDLLKKMDQLFKELKQYIIDKEDEAENEKRPKTLIEAKTHMSEWCDARGKQGTDDLVMKCLALAYLKNPHLDDETYEWILWTWIMKESLEKKTSKELIGEYDHEKVEKVEKEMAVSFGLESKAVKENYGKGTNNNDEEPGLVTDLLEGFNLRMDDNHKMFELHNISVKDIKKFVDADSERPKSTTQGQAPRYLRDYVRK